MSWRDLSSRVRCIQRTYGHRGVGARFLTDGRLMVVAANGQVMFVWSDGSLAYGPEPPIFLESMERLEVQREEARLRARHAPAAEIDPQSWRERALERGISVPAYEPWRKEPQRPTPGYHVVRALVDGITARKGRNYFSSCRILALIAILAWTPTTLREALALLPADLDRLRMPRDAWGDVLWFLRRRARRGLDRPGVPALCTTKGRSWDERDVRRDMARLAQKVGLGRVSPRLLRKCHATIYPSSQLMAVPRPRRCPRWRPMSVV